MLITQHVTYFTSETSMRNQGVDCSMALHAISITASEAFKDNLKMHISPEDIQRAIFNREKEGKKSRVTSWTNPINFNNIIIKTKNQDHECQLKVTNVKPSSLVSNLRDDPNKRHMKHHILKFTHHAVKYNCMRITDIISSGDIYYFKCTHFHQDCNGDVLIEASSKGFQIYHLSVQEMKQKRLNKQLTLRKVSDRGRPEDLQM